MKLYPGIIIFVFALLLINGHVCAQEIVIGISPGHTVDKWPLCVKEIRKIPGANVYRIIIKDEADVCISELGKMQNVLFIEQDTKNTISDRLLSISMFADSVCAGASAKFNVTGIGKGKNVVAAVIDSGIDLSAYRLNLKKNVKEIPQDGIDNDQNGYIDDYQGFDFGDKDNIPEDVLGHGSMVSSVLISIAPDISLMPLKVSSDLDASSGTQGVFSTIDAGEAVLYAAFMGADIINLSFSSKSRSSFLEYAIKKALNSGSLVVASAGNNGSFVEFPANMAGVIAVGSANDKDLPAWFSPAGDALDMLAPGENVCVTGLQSQVSQVSGTSFSTPFVCGIAGVLLDMNQWLTADSLKKIISKGCKDILVPGKDRDSGFGIVNSKKLTTVSRPSLIVPATVKQGKKLHVEYFMPPTDTATDVIVGYVYNDQKMWLDPFGKWHNADQLPYSSVMTRVIKDFETSVLFGINGLFPAVDTQGSRPGKYLLAIGLFDMHGSMLSPVELTEIVLN